MLITVRETSRRMGVEMRLVGPKSLATSLKQIEDTADLSVYATVPEALAGKAA